MGVGGYITLVNGSPFDWILSNQHSYQMNAWDFPKIAAGKANRTYIEWGSGISSSDDGGEAYYSIAGTSNKFFISGHGSEGHGIAVNGDPNPSLEHSKVDLNFRHDGTVNWIASMDNTGRWWSNGGFYPDWMQQSMGSLANRTLRHICMPGSHDAGMSQFRSGTFGATFRNSQAQYLDIYHQLMIGSRYLDIRPVLSSGVWVTGHYSIAEGIGIGGNGQLLADVISQVNQFTAEYKELIIINISHTLDTDNSYRSPSQDQWNDLLKQLKGLRNRYIVPHPNLFDFSTKVLGDFITDRASVFVIAHTPKGVGIGDYTSQGFFSPVNFPISESYSNSDSLPAMFSDQVSKLRQTRNIVSSDAARRDYFFIFSWILTPQILDTLLLDRAILNLAASAFDTLVVDGWNAFTPQSFPNVLYVDALGIKDKSVHFPYDKINQVPVNNDITALAIAVNNGMAGRNSYITK